MPIFNVQHLDEEGLWHTIRDGAGAPLAFPDEAQARQYLREHYAVAVQLAEFAGPKTVRAILAQPYKDVDDAIEEAWVVPKKPGRKDGL